MLKSVDTLNAIMTVNYYSMLSLDDRVGLRNGCLVKILRNVA